jgi:DNA-binding GntR family transcriptional regulator
VLWARYPFDLIHRIGGRVSRAADEHTALIDQLIQGDLSGAMLTMRQHIEQGWSELRDHLRKSEADSSVNTSAPRVRAIKKA